MRPWISTPQQVQKYSALVVKNGAGLRWPRTLHTRRAMKVGRITGHPQKPQSPPAVECWLPQLHPQAERTEMTEEEQVPHQALALALQEQMQADRLYIQVLSSHLLAYREAFHALSGVIQERWPDSEESEEIIQDHLEEQRQIQRGCLEATLLFQDQRACLEKFDEFPDLLSLFHPHAGDAL